MNEDGVILGIETSNPSAGGVGAGVAAGRVENGALVRLGEEAVELGTQRDGLMGAIEALCGRLGLRPRDIARVAVSNGPGGFTGVRIAVTTARLIAEATGAGCVPVPTAKVAARRVTPGGAFGVALASKGQSTFVTCFDGAGGALDDGRIVEAAGLMGLKVERLIADGHLPEPIRRAAEERGWAVEPLVLDAWACVEAGLEGAGVDPLELAPVYPREPEAVTLWRARRGGTGGG